MSIMTAVDGGDVLQRHAGSFRVSLATGGERFPTELNCSSKVLKSATIPSALNRQSNSIQIR